MPARSTLALLAVVLTVACAPQLSPRQALTWDAYKDCQAVGPSARLDRLQADGGWDLVGREGEIYRVHACMLEHWQRASHDGRVPALPTSLTVSPVKAEGPADPQASQSQVRAASVTDSSTSSSSR